MRKYEITAAHLDGATALLAEGVSLRSAATRLAIRYWSLRGALLAAGQPISRTWICPTEKEKAAWAAFALHGSAKAAAAALGISHTCACSRLARYRGKTERMPKT